MTDPQPGILEYWAKQKPDDPAVIEDDRVLTWGAWNDEADRLAHGLRRLGLQAGDVLVTRMQIRAEWPIVSAAAGKLGCRLLGLNWRLTAAETRYVLSDSAARDPAATRALFVLLGEALNNPLIRDQIAALNARSARGFEVNLRAAMTAGEVRRDIDAAAEGFLVLSALRGAVGQWLLAPGAIDLTAVRDEFVAALERNLAA